MKKDASLRTGLQTGGQAVEPERAHRHAVGLAIRTAPCNCTVGCFIEEDAAQRRANFETATLGNSFDHALWRQLDDERLEGKSVWLQDLGADGLSQVRCHAKQNEPEVSRLAEDPCVKIT